MICELIFEYILLTVENVIIIMYIMYIITLNIIKYFIVLVIMIKFVSCLTFCTCIIKVVQDTYISMIYNKNYPLLRLLDKTLDYEHVFQ